MTTKNTSKSEKPQLIVICGPTAVGKTSMAIALAQELNCAIFSADSRQFFKELSIGTAKPNPAELAEAQHYFIDNKSIAEDYNASQYEKEVIEALGEYFQSNKVAILCGGSGLYIDAVCKGFDEQLPDADPELRKELKEAYESKGISFLQEKLKELDPEFYEQVDEYNSKRLLRALEICMQTGKSNLEIRKGKGKERDFEIIKIGLEMPREILYERINHRVDQMMAAGLLDEVKSLKGFRDKNALKTVGYTELFNYLDGHEDLDFAVEKIKVNSRRYAKRQLTWFKKDDEIRWFNPEEKLELLTYIRSRRN